MKVITNREVKYSNACGCSSLEGDYSNGVGDGLSKKTNPTKTGAGKEKALNLFNKVKDSGILNSLGNLLGGQGGSSGGKTIETAYVPTPEPKGMSTQTKVFIGVGVVTVLGIGYYLITKKK
jgi:hypothetical protein